MVNKYPETMKAFKLVPCIKKISECDSLSALMALRNVLNDRIEELKT